MIGVKFQQFDEFLRFGLHVGDQRCRLPGRDDNNIDRFVGDQLDQRFFVGEKARVGFRHRPVEHHPVKRVRDQRRATAHQAAIDLCAFDVMQIIHF